jgi:hypothetical protein
LKSPGFPFQDGMGTHLGPSDASSSESRIAAGSDFAFDLEAGMAAPKAACPVGASFADFTADASSAETEESSPFRFFSSAKLADTRNRTKISITAARQLDLIRSSDFR